MTRPDPAFRVGAGAAPRAEAVVDLDAIVANVAALDARVGDSAVMVVVKADAYGHGLLPAARAALAGGARWLGTAFVEEALALRDAGIETPILCWLAAPGERWDAAIAAGIDVSAGAPWLVDEVAAAARRGGRPARLHLEADSGLSRGGAPVEEWPGLVASALKAQAAGDVRVVGLWSHFACADEPGHPANDLQLTRFTEMLKHAEQAGIEAEVRHMANSPATLTIPQAHFDLVRVGLAAYGLTPVPQVGAPEQFGLTPAMTLSARLALVKRIRAGDSVSYGHIWTAERDTTVGVVPLGYADGVPRHASNSGPVLTAGQRHRIVGRVCMDQFVVDLGPGSAARAGDSVVLFGTGASGEPTAQDWAEAAGTISYEIVTRIGSRVPRRYVGALATSSECEGAGMTA